MGASTTIDPKVQAQAEKILAAQQKAMEGRKADIAKKYPHVQIETLDFDPVANKYFAMITCVKCGNKTRKVFSSDFFQVKTCTECTKLAKADKKAAKSEELKEALALLAARKAEAAK